MKHRRRRLRRYGLTVPDYEALLQSQAGVCALCGLNGSRPLVVDHDHGTGTVRGLLHEKCNLMLGMAGDDPERLRQGAEYLQKFPHISPQRVP